MKLLAATIASLSLIAPSSAQAEETKAEPTLKRMVTVDDVRTVALDPFLDLRLTRPDAVDVPGGYLEWGHRVIESPGHLANWLMQ